MSVATVRSRGVATVAGSGGSPSSEEPGTVALTAALRLPAASARTMDRTSPGWPARLAVKLPSGPAVAVTVDPVRVLVRMTAAPGSTAPAEALTVTAPPAPGDTVTREGSRAAGGTVSSLTLTEV